MNIFFHITLFIIVIILNFEHAIFIVDLGLIKKKICFYPLQQIDINWYQEFEVNIEKKFTSSSKNVSNKTIN